MKLEITFQNSSKKINIQALESILSKTERLLNAPRGIISLVFTDNKNIWELNKKWRNKDAPTDVLTFCSLEGEQFPHADTDQDLGEIFISIEKAKEQAKEKKHDLQKEIEILFTHGVLHILGFTHDTENNYQEMHRWEKEILKN